MNIKVCDICHSRENLKQYIMPRFSTVTACGGKGQVSLMSFKELDALETDLCDRCAKYFADIFAIKKYIEGNNE